MVVKVVLKVFHVKTRDSIQSKPLPKLEKNYVIALDLINKQFYFLSSLLFLVCVP